MTGRTLATVPPRRGETIRRFAVRSGYARGLPTIVVEMLPDGSARPVLRRDWHRRIGARTRLVFVSSPLGGGGGTNGGGSRSVAAVVGLIAVMALASIVAPIAGAALGLGALGTAAASSVVSALIVGGGSYLISHFLGAKKGAKSDAPEYSVDITANRARSQQPIPAQYGRVRFFPDLAAPTWSDYAGADQVFHALYSLGVGDYELREIGIANTPVWTLAGGTAAGFPNFQMEFVPPGAQCTLFPTDVYSASEVSGQVLPQPYGSKDSDGKVLTGPNGETSGSNVLGPFVGNPSGTLATQIAFDLIWPSGLYSVSPQTGKLKPTFVRIVAEYRRIDDQGIPVSGWTVGFDKTYTRETKIPLRLTETVSLAQPCRVEVRIARTNYSTSSVTDAVNWAALKTYLQGQNAVPVASRLAIRMLADKQLSAYSSQQIYVIATRKIPVYNADTGQFVTQASRNPIWAALDVWHNADYGGGLPLDKVDLVTLVAKAAQSAARGDHFDYRFTAQVTLIEAIETCLRPILTTAIFLWDRFSVVRDEPRSLPKLVLTDFEVLRGSLEVAYTLKDAQTSDGVILEYLEEAANFRQAEVTSRAAGAVLKLPTRVQMAGVTNRRQATVCARYLAATNNYRRKTLTCQIEADGRLLRRGDLVAVSSEMPQTWGQSGRVESYDLPSRSIVSAVAFDWSAAGTHWLRLRCRDGSPFGPVLCTRGASDAIAVLDAGDLVRVQALGTTLADALARSLLQDPASIDVAAGQSSAFTGLVTRISTGDAENTFKLELVNDAPEVYTIDTGSIEPLPTPSPLVLPAAPKALGKVVAYISQDKTNAVLYASWQPDPVAATYTARISYDGETWYTVYPEGEVSAFAAVLTSPDALTLRIQGTSAARIRGPVTQVAVAGIDLILNPSSLGYVIGYDDVAPIVFQALALDPISSLEDLLDPHSQALVGAAVVRSTLAQETARAHAKIESVDYVRATADTALAGMALRISATVDDNKAEYVHQVEVQAGVNLAVATEITTLTTKVGQNAASIVQEIQARSDADSAMATALTALNTTFFNYRGAVSASFVSEAQARSTADGALAGEISTVAAQSAAGTANGAISWVAASGVAGLYAAYAIHLSVSGLTTAEAGLYMGVDGNGMSKIVLTAEKFSVQSAGLSFAPFGIFNGTVYLQGVTKVSNTMSSQYTNGNGTPLLQIDWVNGSIEFND